MKTFIFVYFILQALEVLVTLFRLGNGKYPRKREDVTPGADAFRVATGIAVAAWIAWLLWIEKGGAQ